VLQTIELKPIEESPLFYDALEKKLRKFFLKTIYVPLLQELNLTQKKIQNAKNKNPLLDALFKGSVQYLDGKFTGNFNASISKELKQIGAQFDRKTSSFKLQEEEIPLDVKQMIMASEYHWDQKIKKLDQKLSKINPKEIADQIDVTQLFDKNLWRADQDFRKNIKKITVLPELTDYQRQKIAEDWQNNMKLKIEGWTTEQVQKLRSQIFENVMAGKRKESQIPLILKVTKNIQQSHDEAVKKAKFLAHQETRLMMSTFKQARYEEAGSKSYIWRAVHRPHDSSPDHHIPGYVRYTHGLLDGKEILWNSPPITSNPGEPERRNHPGQDYNCRCFARPIIKKNQSSGKIPN